MTVLIVIPRDTQTFIFVILSRLSECFHLGRHERIARSREHSDHENLIQQKREYKLKAPLANCKGRLFYFNLIGAVH